MSVDTAALDKAMNADEVGEELEKVIQILNCTIKLQPPVEQINVNSQSKEDRIAKLREHRKIYFKKDRSAKARHEDEAKEAFSEVYPETLDGLLTNLTVRGLS